MICIYNPDPDTQLLLDEYTDILGSEEAAYYVLSQNNGNGLDKTPDGKDSILFQNLLNIGDHRSAIIKKAAIYSSAFLNKYGDWTYDRNSVFDQSILDANGEPKLSFLQGSRDEDLEKIMNNLFLLDNPSNTECRELSMVEPVDPNSSYATEQMLELSLDDYINTELKQFYNENPNPTEQEIYAFKLEKQRLWYDTKTRSIMTEQTKAMAEAFGLKYVQRPNGQVELQSAAGLSGISALRFKFVQNLTNDPLEDQLLSLVDKKMSLHYTSQIEGAKDRIIDGIVSRRRSDRMVSANTLIYLSLNEGSSVTFSKTLAYHYITMMFDTELIQTSLKALDDTGNRSSLYLVNKLVESITEPMKLDKSGLSLIDRIYSEDVSKEDFDKVTFFNEFWSQFDDIRDQIIKDGAKNKDAVKKILSVVAAAIQLNELDLRTQVGFTPYYDKKDKDIDDNYLDLYSVKYKADVLQLKRKTDQESLFFDALKKAYENKITRLRKQNQVSTGQNVLVKTIINFQNMSNADLRDELKQKSTIEELLKLAYEEVMDAYNKMVELSNDNHTVLEKAKFLTNAYNETISFYDMIIGKMLDPLFSREGNKYEMYRNTRSQILGMLRDLQNKYNNLLLKNTSDYIDAFIDEHMKDGLVTTNDKIVAKSNAKKWLVNQSQYGDLSVYEPWITMNSLSRSSVVRIALNTIQRANRQRERQALAKAVNIARVLKVCKQNMIKRGNGTVIAGTFIPGINFQTIFQEHDADGKPTGYFTRKYNYGQFYKLRNKEIQRITKNITEQVRSDLGNPWFEFETDSNDQPIFPDSEYFDKYWKDYNKRLNAFDCEYGNKRFVKEYYDLRYDTLSRKTIEMQNDIQDRINSILNPVRENGVPHVERLSDEDLFTLYNLRKEQDNLSNQYYPETGQRKQGDELKAALELKKFRDLTKDKILYERKTITDEYGYEYDMYDSIYDKIPDAQKSRFQQFMTTREINPRFWEVYNDLKEKYREQFHGMFDKNFEKIDLLNRERMDIVNTVKDRGYKTPDLVKIPDVLWPRLKEIDDEISSLYEPIVQYLRSLQPGHGVSSPSRSIMEFLDIMSRKDPTKTLYEQFLDDAKQLDEDEFQATGVRTNVNFLDAVKKYSRRVYFTDKYGHPDSKIVPLSVFSYMSPTGFTDELKQLYNIEDNFEYIITQPGPEFNKPVNPDDPRYKVDSFVNPDYDETEDAFVQPKMLNRQYNIIQENPPLKQLYDALTQTMQEANDMIPSSFDQGRYKLPQMRGDSMLGLIGRSLENGIQQIPKGLINSLDYVMKSSFSVNENDDEINDDFTTMPDGTRLNSIPIRFVQMLDKPEFITRDVVGSVIAYYYMALNYKSKSEIEPLLNQLLNQVGQNQAITLDSDNVKLIQGQKTNQYAKLKNVIDSRLYDQDHIFGRRGDKKLSRGEKIAIKTAKNLRRVGILGGLSRNTFSQTTALLDALTETAVFSNSGDLFNKQDFIVASSLLSGNSGKGSYNIGSQLAYGKVAALMQKNGLSKDVQRIFKDTHYSKLRRASRTVGSGMVGFRLADYTINALTMLAIYNNMRYSDKYGTFLNKNDFIGRLMHDGISKSEAEHIYNKSATLYSAYREKGNIAVLSAEYQIKMSEKDINNLEDEVATALKTWTPKFNGAVAEEDKAIIQQNIYGSFVTALRTYLINKAQTNFVTGDDFIDDEHSKKNIQALKQRRKNLIELKSKMSRPDKIDKKITKLQEKLDQYKQELNEVINNNKVSNIKAFKELLTPAGINFGLHALASAMISLPIYAIFPTAGSILFGIGSAITTATTVAAYKNTKKNIDTKHGAKIARIDQLQNKIQSLEAQLRDVENISNLDKVESEIMHLTRDIVRLSTERERLKGLYYYSANTVFHGHIRGFFNAWNNLYQKASWMCKCLFRPDYRNMKYKPSFKLSKQQKIGFRRISTSLTTLFMLWVIASYNLCAYRDNNMEQFLPGKAPIVGKYVKSGAETLLKKENELLEQGAKTLTENETWQNGWEDVHEEFTEGFMSKIPLVNHYGERISDDMLGYTKSVSQNTGEATRKKVDAVQSRVQGFKSVLALQSVRLFTEQMAPYDIQTVNDLFSSVSAPININFKETDATIQLGQGLLDGTIQNNVQRGSWAGYFQRWEYIGSNLMAPFGLPQAYKSYTEPGRRGSLEFRLKLGLNSIFFPKPPKDNKKSQSKSNQGEQKKKSYKKRHSKK